jgi:hypothetical protein
MRRRGYLLIASWRIFPLWVKNGLDGNEHECRFVPEADIIAFAMKSPAKVLLCYGSGKFLDPRDYLVKTARAVGDLQEIRECSASDIPREYRRKHAAIFGHRRGDGYWLWKPFLIQQTMQRMREGDILFYCDAGSHLIASLTPLFRLAAEEPKGVLSFSLDHLERRYTKRICFAHLGMDSPTYTDTPQRLASFILFRVGALARGFAAEWLSYCEKEVLVTDVPSPPPLIEYPDFVENRHDQSLFSLTCKRHQIPGYPDPSQWGNDDPKRHALYPQIIQHTRGMETPSPALHIRLRRFVKKVTTGLR